MFRAYPPANTEDVRWNDVRVDLNEIAAAFPEKTLAAEQVVHLIALA